MNTEESIILSNNLQVLLLYQKYATSVMGSLAVGVGFFNDPIDIPGMAHFLEHALFLGNQKYPEPNGFETFISQNGGTRSAYTYPKYTHYDFTVSPNAINETLER